MSITTSQVTALTDSIAKAISDLNTNFVSGTSSSASTINNGVGGTGASATVGRVLAYADLPSELALLSQVSVSATKVAADISGRRSLSAFYINYYPLLDALDSLVSGLNSYLTTNTLQVNAYFAAAFNAYAASAVNLQFRTSASVPTAIATANYFPYAATDTMWAFTASGATTFSANAVGTNASTAVNGGGVGTFYIYKSNATNAVGGATFTITYTNAAGNSATTTYNTTSGVPTGSGTLSSGSQTLAIVGSAITAVTGTGMTSGEAYVIGQQLVRAAAY